MAKGTRHLLISSGLAVAILWPSGHWTQALAAGESVDSPAADAAPTPPSVNPVVRKMLDESDRAQANGNPGLALVQVRNAVRMAPKSGEVRAHLGAALLKSGDTRSAERELRQAWMDGAPDQLIVPPLLDTMVVRGEVNDLLQEFPEPPRGAQNALAPDILRGRAMALEILARREEANAAMARSLSLRRDARSLTASAKLAAEQGDLPGAQRFIDEAIKIAPADEDVVMSKIALLLATNELDKALTAADAFKARVPRNLPAKVLHIEVLLHLNRDSDVQAQIDELHEQAPESSFIAYYGAVLALRRNDFANAWREAQNLAPEFVLSRPGTALMVAEIALASGNIQSGTAILATLLSRRPDLVEARVRLAAVQLTTMNSPYAALRTLEPIKTSSDPQVQTILGQANMQLGRFNEAIGAYEKSIVAGGSENADALKGQLAQSAFGLGDTDKAIRNLRELEARKPGNWDVLIPLLASLMQSGKLDEALNTVNRISDEGGKNPLKAFYQGRVLGAQGDLAGASAAFGQALSIDPKFVPALYFRAHVRLGRGERDAAKNDLKEIIEQDRGNVYAYIALAQIALADNQEAEAVSLLGTAIKASPQDPAPRLALATLQLNRGKFKDAETMVNDLLRLSPGNPQAISLLGQSQFTAGDTEDAVSTFRSLAARYADSAGTYVLLAKALNAVKDRLAAVDAARRAVELDPFSVQIRSILVEYLIAAGRTNEALANARDYAYAHAGPEGELLVASALIRLNREAEAYAFLTPKYAAKPDRLLARQLSQSATKLGERKKAVAVLVDWLKRNPDDFEVRLQYASLLSDIGETAQARSELETLLKQKPEDPVVLNNLAWTLEEDDPTRALELVTLASKVAPDSVPIMDTLGWLKFRHHDIQTALVILGGAYQRAPENGEIGYHYAMVLDSAGQRSRAKTLLKSVVAKTAPFRDRKIAEKQLARW